MKRMNVVIDREALELARRLTGKKTYSETINHLIAQAVRQENCERPSMRWPKTRTHGGPDMSRKWLPMSPSISGRQRSQAVMLREKCARGTSSLPHQQHVRDHVVVEDDKHQRGQYGETGLLDALFHA